MKAILRILFILLFLIIGIVIAGLFLPSEHKVVINKQVDAGPKIVYGVINNFNEWKSWAPWIKKDQKIQLFPGKKNAGTGAEMSWKSELFSNCKLTMTQSVFPESITVNFDFNTKGKTVSLWYLEPVDDGTLVSWTMSFYHLSIWERYFILFNKDQMKVLLNKGMQSLDSLSLSYSKSRIGEITVSRTDAKPAVIMVDSAKYNRINEKIPGMINYIRRFLDRRKILPADSAFTLFYGNLNDTLVKFACGIPIPERTWVWKTLKLIELPSSKVVTVTHYGFPTDKAHHAIVKYIEMHKLERNGNPFEEYLYDINNNRDTVNWKTKVYYPVK